MALENGSQLGPYQIIDTAGVGGMGEVYKAKDTRLDRTVAIKVLPQSMALNADLKARFEREARAISSLNHPNICTLHDIGTERGIDFLVMEYLEGETLADRLKKGPMSLPEIYDIAIEICDALDKAHRQGLTHRDLKPGNVMLTREGAKLLDFGLAKAKNGDGPAHDITQITQTTPLTGAGTILGTLQYMSPEQLEGAEADARSDIFAFGALLYEMLTGIKAFDGKSQASLIAAIIERDPPSVAELKPIVPPSLDRLVMKCLSKAPEKRWQSAHDLSDELRWISRAGSQAGIPMQVSVRRKFKFNLARAIGLGAILLLLGLGYLYYREISKVPPVIKTTVLPDVGSELNDFAGGAVSISPTGEKIAYVALDTVSNNYKIWVRPLNTLTSFPLKGTDDASFPFWSPDGEYIAFFSDSKLKKILATGGPVLTICEAPSGRPGSWNADDVILFTPSYEGPMFMVSAAGGDPAQVTSLDTTSNDFTHRYAYFLPDGDHFLFFNRTEANAGGERDAICVSSLSDPTIKTLIYAKSNPVYIDGYILFMRQNILMAQKFDAGNLELEGNARPLAEDVSYHDSFSRGIFSASLDGRLTYRKGEVSTGSVLRRYSDNFAAVDTIGEVEEQASFALSNSNDFVAVEIDDVQGSGSDIWIYDLKRSIKRRFTFDASGDGFPVWSPNDSQIVFISTRNDEMGIYTKDTYGSAPVRKIHDISTNTVTWDWSADGKYIVYSSFVPGNAMDLYIYSFDDSFADSVYLATEFMEGAARISPDGRWLAYTSRESGKFEVYVSTFPKHSVKWQVSNKGGFMPKWSRDGEKIYYSGDEGMIYVADVNGQGDTFEVGAITPMFTISTNTNLPIFEITSDEKTIIASEQEEDDGIDQIVHVYNWRSELK